MNLDKGEAKMVLQLAKNDLKSKYSNFFLGIAWAFVMPLITILVFWVVFEAGFRNPPINDVPFILWFAVAYIPWICFQEILISGTNCLMEYSYLVKKIKFNIKIIPLIKLSSALLIHAFFIIFLLVCCAIYQVEFTAYMLQAAYYSFAMSVFSLGLVYLLSAFTIFFKDMSSIVNVIIQIGFWITPILWNEETMENELIKNILGINPMHYIVSGYRDSFINHCWFWERGAETVYFWIVTVIVCIAGIRVFYKLSPFFADEV